MTPDISVVIPLFNEALNLGELYEELTKTLEATNRTYELILVDDGSFDETYPILTELHHKDRRVSVVKLRRNFGQTAAFAAGFSRARGRFIVTTDGDLQNDPRDIPTMLAKIEQGYDMVCGWRKDRKDPWLTRRVPSMIANWLISVTTGVSLHDYGCSLKVFTAEVIKPLRLYGEMHRFIPAIASEQGVRIAELVVNHRPRRFGRSKYGLSRTVRVVFDLVTVKIPAELFDTAPPNVRSCRVVFGHHRGSSDDAPRVYPVVRRDSDRRPSDATARGPDGVCRSPARHDWSVGRAAGAHVPRISREGDIRHQGGSRELQCDE